jgi:hypothetical protein
VARANSKQGVRAVTPPALSQYSTSSIHASNILTGNEKIRPGASQYNPPPRRRSRAIAPINQQRQHRRLREYHAQERAKRSVVETKAQHLCVQIRSDAPRHACGREQFESESGRRSSSVTLPLTICSAVHDPSIDDSRQVDRECHEQQIREGRSRAANGDKKIFPITDRVGSQEARPLSLVLRACPSLRTHTDFCNPPVMRFAD